MSMTLTSLPTEVFICVVASIESQSTLCSLARCSRKLYFWTIPHIYCHVTIQKEPNYGRLQDGDLRNFASLVLRRQDLAGLVRPFTLRALQREAETPKTPKTLDECEHVGPKDDKVDQTLKAAVYALSSSEVERNNWLRNLSRTSHGCRPELLLALLLPALLKLRKLVLEVEIDFNKPYLERMLQRAARKERSFNNQPPLEALTTFVHSHVLASVPSAGFIALLLKLPAIQEISGIYLGNRYTEKNLIELDSSSSPLISLDLVAFGLMPVDLGHLLRAPKALKTFFYHLSPPGYFNFAEIRHALEPQKNCLKSLGLDHVGGRQTFYGEVAWHTARETYGPMTSFTSFTALEIFKTAAIFLETINDGIKPDNLIDFFPPNLETLHLARFHADFENLLEAVEHLLARKSPQQIPSLKKVVLEIETFGSRRTDKVVSVLRKSTQTVIGRLSKVAEAQGVSLDVIGVEADRFSQDSSP